MNSLNELIAEMEGIKPDDFVTKVTKGLPSSLSPMDEYRYDAIDDCIALIKTLQDDYALMPKNRIESIIETLEIIGNYGSEVLNTKDLCMAMAKELSGMLSAEGDKE